MGKKGQESWNRTEFDDAKLKREYLGGRPVVEIAEEYGCSPPAVYRRLHEFGIVRSRAEAATGQVAWNRRGWYKDSHGYIYIQLPKDSPFLSMTTGRRYVREHRLVMARHLGCPLEPWQVVHHKNRVKDDNRLENLELFPSQSYHLSVTLLQKRVGRLEEENRRLKQQLEYCHAQDSRDRAISKKGENNV